MIASHNNRIFFCLYTGYLRK